MTSRPGPADPAPCWCEANDWNITFRTKRFGLIQCRRCGSYRLDPRPLQHSDAAPEFYSAFYADLARSGTPRPSIDLPAGARFWLVAKQVPDLGLPGVVAADIGCGEGGLCSQLRQLGWQQVVGVDVSDIRIRKARERHPQIEFHTSLAEARIAPGSLDLVVLDNVVEHLLDPRAMLAEVRRYLQPEGRLVVITPNMRSGHFRLLGRRWTPELCPDQHIHLFTVDAMQRLLSALDFRVERLGSIQVPSFPFRVWLGYVRSGDLKEAVWRFGQEVGTWWGRAIGQGPMMFAVARPISGRSSGVGA